MNKSTPFGKAVIVISSCNNIGQMDAAFRYLKLAGAQYNDNNHNFRILAKIWTDKLSQLKRLNKMLNVGDMVEYEWFGNLEYACVLKVYQDDLNQTVVLVSSGCILPIDCVNRVEE